MRPSLRSRPRRNARRVGPFYRRALIASGLLFSLWAAIHYGREIYTQFQPSPIAPEREAKLLSGSILFVPLSGNTCRQNLIDNATGEIRGNGLVECDEAKAQNAARWAAQVALQRQMAIRDSFVNK